MDWGRGVVSYQSVYLVVYYEFVLVGQSVRLVRVLEDVGLDGFDRYPSVFEPPVYFC